MDSGASLSTIAVGVAPFASTNIDDIFLLSAFFANKSLPSRSVVVGQFLGIGALTAVSGAAALASLVIPDGWTALLGLVPLLLGVHKLWHMRADLRLRDEHNERARDKAHVLEQRSRSRVLAIA